MKILDYTLQFSTKKKFNWKKFKTVIVDNYKIIEKNMETDYCPYTCSSHDYEYSKVVFETSDKEEAEAKLKSFKINLAVEKNNEFHDRLEYGQR